MITRQNFVLAALGLQGTLYQWGGQLYRGDYGTDCSGLVADAFHRAGAVDLAWELGDRWSSTSYASQLRPIDIPLPGDLWVYGDPVQHVTVHVGSVGLDGLHTEPLILSASGGGRDVLTPEIARARRARVVLVPLVGYHQRRPPRFAVSMARFFQP